MKRKISVVALLFMISISCKKAEQPEKAPQNYSEIKKSDWFLGRWENNSKAGNLSETWIKTNDSVYHSESHFVVGIDTVFSEKIELAEKQGNVFYTVTVPGQNGEKPVTFERTSANANTVIFENPKHDFPNRIVYNRVGDSLIAEISGMKNGKQNSERFAMKRAN